LRQSNRTLPFIATVWMAFAVGGWAQGQQAPATSASPSHESEQVPTFKVATRMVTIDVVARDGKGNSLRNLKSDDFEVTEQIEPRREKYVQKVAAFRATSVAEQAKRGLARVVSLVPPPGTTLVRVLIKRSHRINGLGEYSVR